MELLQWVEINQKPPSSTSTELFSDGSKIGSFWAYIKNNQKIDQSPYDILKSNQILMLAYQESQESQQIKQTKLTIEKKVMELLQWVEINKKTPHANKNQSLFTDGSKIGNFWDHIKQKNKIEQLPYNQLKSNPILMEAYQKNQKSKLIIKLTLEQKVNELLQWVEINQKPPPANKNSPLFTDGSKMGGFWLSILKYNKINKLPFNKIKNNDILIQSYDNYKNNKLKREEMYQHNLKMKKYNSLIKNLKNEQLNNFILNCEQNINEYKFMLSPHEFELYNKSLIKFKNEKYAKINK